MNAAETALSVSANNIANVSTPDYRRQQVQSVAQPGAGVDTSIGQASAPGPDLETDIVNQLQAKNAFMANVDVFKASERMTGALLNITA